MLLADGVYISTGFLLLVALVLLIIYLVRHF